MGLGHGCGAPLAECRSYPLPIRNTFVPQVEQVPCVAGRPFFNVTFAGLRISRFVLHFMQYASICTSMDLDWGQCNTSPEEEADLRTVHGLP